MTRMQLRGCAGIALFLAGLGGCGVLKAQEQSYLPLDPGAQWELRSNASSQPMIFTVENSVGTRSDDKAGQVARVDWQNPWVKAKFIFRVAGKRVLLDGLDMGNGLATMPSGTTYFDFDERTGARWSNSVGSFSVATTDATVKAPAGTYAHCVEIVAIDAHGSKTFWFFAPGVGFVQFGEGSSAFQLARYSKAGGTGSLASEKSKLSRDETHPTDVKIREGGLYLGLESNPTPAQGYSFDAKRQSAMMSSQAGSRLIFVGPKWEEVEPSPGHYNFNDVDERVKLAKATGSVVLLNLRLIDTSRKTVPAAYQGWDWDDQRLEAKLVDLFSALAQHTEGRARWVTVGNEVDTYLKEHEGEIEPYARMLAALSPYLHRDFPNAPLTVNFTSEGESEFRGRYRSIVDQTQIDSINYYPINRDFTFRDPSTCGRELQNIIAAATGHPIVFQEMGYPSSAKLGSSEDKQGQFLDAVLHVLAANAGRVQAASFNWRGDLPDSVVHDLTSYYKLGNNDNFREFLATLGWFHQDNTPKKIWYVFQKGAPTFLPAR